MKPRTLVILAVIAILAVGGFFFYEQFSAASARAAATTRSAGTVTRGNLAATVTGAGNISAPQQTNLSFQLSGVPLTKIYVQVGDKVKAGDVLAQVDDADLQYSVRSAQANLASAQANLAKLKQPASDSDIATAKAQVTSAQAAYDAAVAKLAALKAPPKQSDLVAAQAALASAQAAYNAAVAKNAHSGDQITVAKAALDKASIALQQAQAAYDRIAWRSDAATSTQVAALQAAKIDYQSALASYNLVVSGINDASVKSAAQNVAQAQANLIKLTTGPTEADLAAAQASIDSAQQSTVQAKANLNGLLQGATPQDLQVAQSAVDNAQTALDQAQRKLDQAKIIAPFDGTIAVVNYVEGQLAAVTPAVITLVNLDNLQTQINLSEVDIAKVHTNEDVTLTFDALGGRGFPGKIISVAPVGSVTQGVVNYVVTVALPNPNAAIKPGMTATASIVVEQRQNVLLVPNRAIRTQGNQRSITILFEGKEIPVAVQTGLNNEESTEILAAFGPNGQPLALQNGDTVVLNQTTTTTTRGFGGGGGAIFIGPGR